PLPDSRHDAQRDRRERDAGEKRSYRGVGDALRTRMRLPAFAVMSGMRGRTLALVGLGLGDERFDREVLQDEQDAASDRTRDDGGEEEATQLTHQWQAKPLACRVSCAAL